MNSFTDLLLIFFKNKIPFIKKLQLFDLNVRALEG